MWTGLPAFNTTRCETVLLSVAAVCCDTPGFWNVAPLWAEVEMGSAWADSRARCVEGWAGLLGAALISTLLYAA